MSHTSGLRVVWFLCHTHARTQWNRIFSFAAHEKRTPSKQHGRRSFGVLVVGYMFLFFPSSELSFRFAATPRHARETYVPVRLRPVSIGPRRGLTSHGNYSSRGGLGGGNSSTLDGRNATGNWRFEITITYGWRTRERRELFVVRRSVVCIQEAVVIFLNSVF